MTKELGFKEINQHHRLRLFGVVGIILLVLLCFGCGGGGDDDPPNPSGDSDHFSVEHSNLTYRNYESGNERYQMIASIANDGSPCVESDVVEVIVRDAAGADVPVTSDGFYRDIYMRYNCGSGACRQEGPVEATGISARFDLLSAGTYSAEIEMTDGQILDLDIDFPGKRVLPYIQRSSMSAIWQGGDLQLSWSNPTTEPNWDQVKQLRIVIEDDLGNKVLYVRPPTTDESITLPEALLSQAAGLRGGNALQKWRVQTRAFDSNGMNFARGYSNKMDLP